MPKNGEVSANAAPAADKRPKNPATRQAARLGRPTRAHVAPVAENSSPGRGRRGKPKKLQGFGPLPPGRNRLPNRTVLTPPQGPLASAGPVRPVRSRVPIRSPAPRPTKLPEMASPQLSVGKTGRPPIGGRQRFAGSRADAASLNGIFRKPFSRAGPTGRGSLRRGAFRPGIRQCYVAIPRAESGVLEPASHRPLESIDLHFRLNLTFLLIIVNIWYLFYNYF